MMRVWRMTCTFDPSLVKSGLKGELLLMVNDERTIQPPALSYVLMAM